MTDAATRNGSPAVDQADLRFLVEKNADGIIVVDGHGAVVFANPAALEIFGRSAEELVGSPIGLPMVAGETTEIALLRPGGGKTDAEIRVVETVWDGRPALLATLRDVSARRVVEERLRHAAKMEAIGRLTAGIAHDFNNLLTVVLGNLAAVQRQLAGGDTGLQRQIADARHGAERAAALTQRLLGFSRRQPLAPRPVDLGELVSRMSDLLRRTLGESIEVSIRLAADLGWAEVDPTELETAILNLAVNARDAMPGGGRLVIEAANAAIGSELPDMRPGDYLQLSVSDAGTGMPPEVLAHVFEPFFTTKDIGQGTGLGLTQVHGFVKQSRGHVRIDSAAGRGTTVSIWLPRCPAAAPVRAETPRPLVVPRAMAGETILVVEDDERVRRYSAASLAELGYRVLEAADGPAALALLAAEPTIDLLFTDFGLPGGMTGLQVAQEARHRRPSLKVVLTTAYGANGSGLAGARRQGLDLLTKPFTFEMLAQKMRQVLDRERPAGRILVVEDEALVRLMIVDGLRTAGLAVEEAGTAGQALAKFHEDSAGVAAAIVDVGLPDRRGDTLVAELRAARPDLPVVLATGYSDRATLDRFAGDERVRLVAKPFDESDLREALIGLGLTVPRPA